jgi:diguanylate cyclase (GGDEF)-like protein/PAS domain S-box-containing protein
MQTRIASGCFAVWMLLLTAVFYLVPQWSAVSWAAIGLSAAGAVLAGIRMHRPSRRLPWLLLSAVLVSFTAGDTAYNILTDYLGQQNPFPSLADLFYLAVYPMLAAALLIFIRARSSSGNRAALLDALVPTAGLGLLAWVFLIAPYVHDSGLTLAEKLTSVAYPLGDVLALAMLLRLFTAAGRKPVAVLVLGAGVTGLLVTDVLYGLRQLAGTWAVGGPTDSGWVFFYAAIGICALHPSMTKLTFSTERAAAAPAGARRLVLMSLAALIAPAMLFLEDARGDLPDAQVIAAACALMFLMVMARVGGLLSQQREAGARERALRVASSALVAAASERDAAAALSRAVAGLMRGEPYHLIFAADDVTGDEHSAGVRPGHHSAIVEVATLPADLAGRLGDFGLALYTEVLGSGHSPVGPGRRKQAYLAARDETLLELRPVFDALMAQAVMAIERIRLTDEISRRSSEDYFRTLVHSTSDVILIVGEDSVIRYASPSATTVFGWTELLGTSLDALIAGTDRSLLADLLLRAGHGAGGPDGTDLIAVGADGRLRQVECGCRDLREDPTVGGLVLTVRDVTERRRLENDLSHQAFHDGLTGLPNRVLFSDRLRQAALRAQRDSTTMAVLFIDLDDFKEVNDTLGHAVGDRLLVAVGERITTAIGPLNTAARMGGDEFAVLIEHAAGPAEADEMAARIVAALAVPVELSDGAGGSHVVSGAASVGVATNQEASGIDELQRQADLAMYVAKTEGKSTWQRYRNELHTTVVQRVELRSALKEAVAAGQFVLRYQPIVDLATERMVGVEALVRWQHPTRGLLGPDEFIDLAEENGTIVALGDWVLREALGAFAGWRTGTPGADLRYISVNVSARQFNTPGFVSRVRAALEETGTRPEWLLLEITESLVLRDVDKVCSDLRALRDTGIRVAIDDFGTGYSSLSYLRNMPVDVLKIDKSFVDEILDSVEQRAVVEAIVSLARTLRLAVVAEGIEDPAHRLMLIGMGCAYGQGYLFARPVPAEQITAWLTPLVAVT